MPAVSPPSIPLNLSSFWTWRKHSPSISPSFGPEVPLVAGVVDRFRAAGRLIVGPTQANARLEGSKIFAKRFFADNGLPTARFHSTETFSQAHDALNHASFPIVIKADGLAAGKGVVIAQNRAEAEAAIEQLGPTLVIEEFLTGEEISFIVLSDGKDALVLEPCQDHKAAYDGDTGPNTGGMGAYCDSRILTPAERATILDTIIRPTIARTGFTGFLYAGLMMTADGPKLLEYNVRLGDPETQPILHRMVADFGQVLLAAAQGNLQSGETELESRPFRLCRSCGRGLPECLTCREIVFAESPKPKLRAPSVFQAGTREGADGLETAGGRVLGVTARGDTLSNAIQNAYTAASRISFAGQHFRTDIGRKGLSRWPAIPLQ